MLVQDSALFVGLRCWRRRFDFNNVALLLLCFFSQCNADKHDSTNATKCSGNPTDNHDERGYLSVCLLGTHPIVLWHSCIFTGGIFKDKARHSILHVLKAQSIIIIHNM